MFTKEYTYPNFLGDEVTDKFRFNISEFEMLDLVRDDPDFSIARLSALVKEHDAAKMINIIRKLLVVSYGVLSEDGKHFRKSDEIATEFVQSAAYNAILNEFLTSDDPKILTDFMYGIFPAKFQTEMKNQVEKAKANGTVVSFPTV